MNVRLVRRVCVLIALLTAPTVNAAIVSMDWQTSGDNLVTRDTDSGLEWLDLTAASNLSHGYVSTEFGAGGEFEGWRYATNAEVAGFFDAFGGDSNYYNGWSTQNQGLFDNVALYWGDLYCEANACSPGDGQSDFMVAGTSGTNRLMGEISDLYLNGHSATKDWVQFDQNSVPSGTSSPLYGHALVRASAVPLPASVWLFGSAVGLLGWMRRRKLGMTFST